MKWMDVEAVAQLAGEAAHVRVHAGDVDRRSRIGKRTGVEERRHQREVVELAHEARTRAILPAVPDGVDHLDHLAQLRARMFPLHSEAALVVAFDLRAETEDETSARKLLQVPSNLRQHQRAARE